MQGRVLVGQGQGQLRNMGRLSALSTPTFLDRISGSIKARGAWECSWGGQSCVDSSGERSFSGSH